MPRLAVVVEVDDAFEQHVAQVIHAVFVECAVFGHEVFEPIEAAAEALVVDFGVGGGAGGEFALQEGEAVVAEVVPCAEAAGFADVFGGAHHFAGVAAAFKQALGFFAVGGVFKIFLPGLEAEAFEVVRYEFCRQVAQQFEHFFGAVEAAVRACLDGIGDFAPVKAAEFFEQDLEGVVVPVDDAEEVVVLLQAAEVLGQLGGGYGDGAAAVDVGVVGVEGIEDLVGAVHGWAWRRGKGYLKVRWKSGSAGVYGNEISAVSLPGAAGN